MTGVALVSGASRGIGAATAVELARRGHHVVVNYRSAHEAAAAVVAAIEADGGHAQAIAADVCDEEQAAALVERVAAEHGRIDVLVCNANAANPPLGGADTPWPEFIDKVERELAASFHLTRHVLAVMRPRRSGRIVHVSSTASERIGGSVAHTAAKAALNAYSRHVAAEAGRYGVLVNVVMPGVVDTEASAPIVGHRYREHLRENSVVGRVLTAADVARVIAQTVELDVVSGEVLRVDGGFAVLDPPGWTARG